MPTVDEAYKSQMQAAQDNKAAYEKSKTEAANLLEKNFNTANNTLIQQRDAANRNALLTRANSSLALSKSLARQGIRGGASQTALSNLYKNQLAANSEANANYTNSYNNLWSNWQTNLLQSNSNWDDRIADANDQYNAAQLAYAQYLAQNSGGGSSYSKSPTSNDIPDPVRGPAYLYNGAGIQQTGTQKGKKWGIGGQDAKPNGWYKGLK